MKIHQHATLTQDPILPFDAATKQYVDNSIISGAIVGGLFFTNISPTSTGNVGTKLYISGTTPANTVITDATTDTGNVTVTLYAEGGSAFFSPTVTVTTVPAQSGGPITATLTQSVTGDRVYTAVAYLTGITADTTVSAVSSTNASATATIHWGGSGPAFSSLTIGAYPGAQTAVKAGDVLSVTGVVANAAVSAQVNSGFAAGSTSSLSLGAADSAGAGFKTVTGTFTVGSGTGNLGIKAQASNAIGTVGALFTSSNSVLLDQTYPSIGAFTITYPSTQAGIKSGDSATVASTVTNFDTISYTSPNVTITSPLAYAATKSVTFSSGSYYYGTNNYTVIANRAANNATTTASTAITIANVAPQAAITIGGSPVALLSSAAGTVYTITITADQYLAQAPTLTASAGTLGGTWTGSGTTWTNTLTIHDTDAKGAQSFSGLTVNGLSNLTGSTISSGASYTIEGFANRTITFPAFAQYASIGTHVVNVANLTVSYTGSTVLTYQTSTAYALQGYTITDSTGTFDPTGDYLFITDAAFAGANTTGTLQLDIAEAA